MIVGKVMLMEKAQVLPQAGKPVLPAPALSLKLLLPTPDL
jgi:hypothetical protein